MCFPPFCHPATHVLGCLDLRQGSAGVLIINAIYGICLIVIHSLLLGEPQAAVPTPAQSPYPSAVPVAIKPGDGSHWFLQLMDMDISWGHNLMGLDNETNLVGGLVYGIIIVLLCGYMFYAIFQAGATLPTTTRWFCAFMNLELIVYVGLAIIKIPKLCKMQATYLDDLYMECKVLQLTFVERAIALLIAGSLCTWIFSSFAYNIGQNYSGTYERANLANVMDDPSQIRRPGGLSSQLSLSGRDMSLMSRHNLAGVSQMPNPRFDMVGGPVSVAAGGSVRMPAGQQRTSYNIGMARASSSHVSSTTDRSYPEMQALIKPPVAIF